MRSLRLGLLFGLFSALSNAALNPLFEKYEGGSEAEEQKLIQKLAEKFQTSQVGVGKVVGHNLRGTHAKGSCLDGEVEIFEAADTFFAKGAFGSAQKNIPARIRFANASSTIQDDFVPDVRSISFSFEVKGQLQDFSMNNDPVFTFGTLTDFTNFMGFMITKKGMTGSAEEQAAAQKLFFQKNPDVFLSVQRALGLGGKQQGQDVAHYYTEKYFTGTAFSFGPGHAAKFRLDPCDGVVVRSEPLKSKVGKPHFLQTDLADAVNSKDAPEKVCFYLSVELLDAEKMKLPAKLAIWESLDKTLTPGEKAEPWQWVEYATLNWTDAREKAGLAPVRLAKLTAKSNSMKSPAECDAVKNAFKVHTNTFEDTVPMGAINRARNPVERQSQKLRN